MDVEVLSAADSGRKLRAARLSVIIPIYDEEQNVPGLCDRLFEVLQSLSYSFEVIAVNDGSKDGSLEALRRETGKHPELKVVDFRRNFGQTAALMAGIDYSAGEIIVSIDADLQNDPDDIPLLVAKLAEGYDVVSGWRKNRQDPIVRRVFVSRVANFIISLVSGVKLTDYGCTLKAYRRDVVKGIRLYGEMHRFIPIYASWMGAKVVEMPVRHHPRRFGRSKYGLGRVIKVLLDLMVVKFLDQYFVKPIYVFGGFGLLSLLVSFLAGSYMLYLKVAEGYSMIQTPLLLLAAMTFLVGAMSILMGLLAEILIRTYFESQARATYAVRELVNFGNEG
jgi:glycosyltransferase involved in cell wall biosynthesis